MLIGLLDGRAWTATELARYAGVANSTASEHLHVLVGSGLLEERRAGRHRYLRLKDPSVSELLEKLSLLTVPTAPRSSLSAVSRNHEMRAARTCYDHLAGELGVLLLAALRARRFLTAEFLTREGAEWCASIGVDVEAVRGSRRPIVRYCLDWTERLDHLAGGLGPCY
ncbi:ArsR/SmtB family transcription factor [Leucobacter coleopterorum]|uniref:ArsR/SmtB family transcription factor n=1 Tax=Leucobacter coleopterorum TaxID=2714933 RepID=UPI003CC732A2